MLNQEELKEQQEKTFNNNKTLQLFIQTILFSLLVYILFSKVCITFIQNHIGDKIEPHIISSIIFGFIYLVIMNYYII
jgi:hypothetical protein